jgi:hypothetical protein
VGLQFHLDYSAASIEKMIASCGDELVEAPHIQQSPALLTDPARVKNLRALLDSFLDAMERHL